jgi:hypothetical protein
MTLDATSGNSPLNEPQLRGSFKLLVLLKKPMIDPTTKYFDRATCLLACRDKWFESRKLGLSTLFSQQWDLPKLYFFQSGQESKVITRPFLKILRNTVSFCASYPEALDIGELPKEPAPRDSIHGICEDSV